MHLSIAFIQMLKSLGTVIVFGIGCIVGLEKFSLATLANMVRQSPHIPCERAYVTVRCQQPNVCVFSERIIE